MKLISRILILFTAILFISGCKKDDHSDLRILLKNQTGNFEHFFVNVYSVQINMETSSGAKSWQMLDVKDGFYDLLDIPSGTVLIGSKNDLGHGKIKIIRVIFGPGNYAIINGKKEKFSGSGAELNINLEEDFSASKDYFLNLDLNSSATRERAGSPFNFNPVGSITK